MTILNGHFIGNEARGEVGVTGVKGQTIEHLIAVCLVGNIGNGRGVGETTTSKTLVESIVVECPASLAVVRDVIIPITTIVERV